MANQPALQSRQLATARSPALAPAAVRQTNNVKVLARPSRPISRHCRARGTPSPGVAPAAVGRGRQARLRAVGDKNTAFAAASVEVPVQDSLQQLQEDVAAKAGETFRWFDHWYPIHVLDCLDASRPHHAQLLGKDLVLWRDGKGQWNCMEDFCPHRLAPLSEGRVEADGQLLCAYHGWRFDSSGKCTDLPQAERPVSEWDPKQIPCAVSFPTMESHGLLFVWPEAGPEAEAKARATAPRSFPELVDEELLSSGKVTRTSWVIRDVPYGWDFFMENALDPAHVPVSHHGIVGDRYKDPQFFELIAEKGFDVQEGFRYKVSTKIGGLSPPAVDFQPPCHVRIASDNSEGQAQTNITLYAVPTTPGHCRTLACQTIVAGSNGSTLGHEFLNKFSRFMPKWLDHLMGTVFVHQDMVFLHHQEKIVARRLGREGIRTVDGYVMPTPSDKLTVMFRTWFERFSGGIPWAPGTPQELPPAEHDSSKLFDVYHAHTKHCSHCMGAVKGTELWQKITAGLAVVSLACGIAVYAGHCASMTAAALATAAASKAAAAGVTISAPALYAPPVLSIGLGLLAAALVGVASLLGAIREKLHIHEFSHADNN